MLSAVMTAFTVVLQHWMLIMMAFQMLVMSALKRQARLVTMETNALPVTAMTPIAIAQEQLQ